MYSKKNTNCGLTQYISAESKIELETKKYWCCGDFYYNSVCPIVHGSMDSTHWTVLCFGAAEFSLKFH